MKEASSILTEEYVYSAEYSKECAERIKKGRELIDAIKESSKTLYPKLEVWSAEIRAEIREACKHLDNMRNYAKSDNFWEDDLGDEKGPECSDMYHNVSDAIESILLAIGRPCVANFGIVQIGGRSYIVEAHTFSEEKNEDWHLRITDGDAIKNIKFVMELFKKLVGG